MQRRPQHLADHFGIPVAKARVRERAKGRRQGFAGAALLPVQLGRRGAGYVENANQRIVLSTEGQALTPEQLSQVVLRYQNGTALRLADVANVAIDIFGRVKAEDVTVVG